MKKSNGNMYDDVVTWNPLGGNCPHQCAYCSTNRLKRFPVIKYKYSGELRLFSDLHKLPKKPATIFVVAQNDLFAEAVPDSFILRVLSECQINTQHRYFFQTKNPGRYLDFKANIPTGSILCTTIETNRYYPGIMQNSPIPFGRVEAMSRMRGFEKHVTVEPIMEFDMREMVAMIKYCNPARVNIGADSKGNNLPEPSKEKILALIEALRAMDIEVKPKSNLARLIK